ncbi:hypothetical protein K503DRAFT_723284 [Rhizopogon vinicolor AM-OR11-026]|uniref:F-box domain-containing protein n=1 Tax=Rhizopogon vinicolor AM-OR11-026 TaxID=1314800 RepID=A0A1B7MRK0_9AGAM|nr:hypothetical protein K503DRAFT_723284 [Rhizopogon vinicolor AM-OR11-026]
MNLHKGLLSALWRLSDEVLYQTFLQCLPEPDIMQCSPELPPLLLTRICRRWREVAVDMPGLWCRLFMEIDGSNWQQSVFCYDSWLKRSQGLPLALELCGNADDATGLQSLLEPYNNQISSLVIYDDVTEASDLLLRNLPALRELTLMGGLTRFYQQPVAGSILRLPLTLRSLRLIEGACIDTFQHLCSFNPVWAHLTHVEIVLNDPHIFLHLLQLGLNLSSVMIHLIPRHNNVIPALEPITHTNLQFLYLVCDWHKGRSPLHGMFASLSLPILRVLVARDVGVRWPHEEFQAFLARSNCPLESLTLPAGRTLDEQRAEYIALLPSLKVLEEYRRP